MNTIQKDALFRTKGELFNKLDVFKISQKLFDKKICTDVMMEKIMRERTNSDQIKCLIEILNNSRDPDVYQSFLSVLDETDYGHLSKSIKDNEESAQKDRERPSPIPIQEVNEKKETRPRNRIYGQGPTSSRNVSMAGYSARSEPVATVSAQCTSAESSYKPQHGGNLLAEGCKESIPIQSSDHSTCLESGGKKSKYQKNKHKSYKMESDPRGVTIIINNKQFENHGERTGTDHDCHKLEELFCSLGFKVIVHDDLKAHEMLNKLNDFRKDQQGLLDKVDCIVLAVLSHGTFHNAVFGIDGKPLNVYTEIYPIFSKCDRLSGKPKMYIFNACRGDKSDQLIECDENVTVDVCREGQSKKVKNSANKDTILCFSTFQGHSSFRDVNQGSFFVREFVEVFKDKADVMHVSDMLTRVTSRVTKGGSQTPTTESTLTSSWYLNPPSTASQGATGFALTSS